MSDTNIHRALQLRVDTLAHRIMAADAAMRTETTAGLIRDWGPLHELRSAKTISNGDDYSWKVTGTAAVRT